MALFKRNDCARPNQRVYDHIDQKFTPKLKELRLWQVNDGPYLRIKPKNASISSNVYSILAIVDVDKNPYHEIEDLVEIIEKEQISDTEFFEMVMGAHTMIKTYDEIISIKRTDKGYNEFVTKKFINGLTAVGYSQTFALILLERTKYHGVYHCEGVYNKAIAFAEEGLSRDMRAFLLLGKR